jgi:hypothetical protein
MANEEKKKSKIAEAAEGLSAVDSLNAAMVVAGAYIPEGTVVKFDYTFDHYGEDAKSYTYVALWVPAQSRWYITGQSGAISREMTNPELAKILASPATRSAITMVDGESFK